MKKIFTILAIAAVSTSAFAQTDDLSIAFTNISAGGTYQNSVDMAVDITNEGSTTLNIGDTLVIGLNLDDSPYSFALTANNFSVITLSSALAPGQSLNIPYTFNVTSASGNPIAVCAVVYGIGIASVDTNASPSSPFPMISTWDANFGDNKTCITYDPNVTSIQELNAMADKVFFANNQLVYDWTNINEANEAIVRMTSINGQTVLSETVQLNEGRNRLDVNNLATGLYLVTFQVNGEAATTKIYVK